MNAITFLADQHTPSVSFAKNEDEEDAERVDSIHDTDLVDVAAVRASVSVPSNRQQGPARRGSLFEACRRASTFIGDGICESRKELKLLGIIPEPEDDDEVELMPMPIDIPPSAVSRTISVPTTLVEFDEVCQEYGVSPTDTSTKIPRRMSAAPVQRTITEPSTRDFEAEQNEEREIRTSLQAFAFSQPPPPPVRTLLEHYILSTGWKCTYEQIMRLLPHPLPPPPKISREEMMWSKISPSTSLMSSFEALLFRENLAISSALGQKQQPYIDGFEMPKWERVLEDVLDVEVEYERLSTEPAFCSEGRLWVERFPLEWKHWVRSSSV